MNSVIFVTFYTENVFFSLPYIEATIRESLRHEVPLPSVSRSAMANTTVMGYDIPKVRFVIPKMLKMKNCFHSINLELFIALLGHSRRYITLWSTQRWTNLERSSIVQTRAIPWWNWNIFAEIGQNSRIWIGKTSLWWWNICKKRIISGCIDSCTKF